MWRVCFLKVDLLNATAQMLVFSKAMCRQELTRVWAPSCEPAFRSFSVVVGLLLSWLYWAFSSLFHKNAWARSSAELQPAAVESQFSLRRQAATNPPLILCSYLQKEFLGLVFEWTVQNPPKHTGCVFGVPSRKLLRTWKARIEEDSLFDMSS